MGLQIVAKDNPGDEGRLIHHTNAVNFSSGYTFLEIFRKKLPKKIKHCAFEFRCTVLMVVSGLGFDRQWGYQ